MEEQLTLNSISKSFGALQVFDRFSVGFPKGKTTCLLGPSGCGKTTLLRMIAGTIKPDSGDMRDFEDQTFSFVFQEDRLLPWKTASENIRLVLNNKLSTGSAEAIVGRNLELVKMKDFANYYPHQLSGGMRQRISFARAFSFPSEVILLDEPFKGLDMVLKKQLMENVRSILSDDPRTVIYVTHEPEEAAYFGEKIIVLSDKPVEIIGELTQEGGGNSTMASYDEMVYRIKQILQAGTS
jgi:NitT/TauT family transport system ATP-binding protein